MRIACLQFAPKVADISNNITRADAVLSKADPDDLENLDLLVLPEMALSGYNFRSQEHIEPHVEPTASGVSSQWARTAARKYRCTVAVGYPERVETAGQGQEPDYYNSLIVVDQDGEKLANYSKSFLYYTDATWAREGPGFYGGTLGTLGQTAMGICMDINPYKFEAPWDAYEFAFHILRVRANLVILSMAWLTHDEATSFLSCPDAPDLSTLTYWVQRLEPVIQADRAEETIVVFANRSGVEDEATYAGTSTVIGIKDGEVSVYGILGRGVEELLVVDTEKPPFGKIINRPVVPVDGEPRAPPAPAGEPEDGPKDAGTGASGGYVDSPTLPSGFTPSSSRTHTNLPPRSLSTTLANNKINNATPTTISRPTAAPAKPTPRPKLSLQTNLPPPSPFSASPSTKFPSRHHLPASPPEPDTITSPPSAIPIFVDVYTPDDEPAWQDNRSVRFGIDALSPWSTCTVSSCRSAASSPLGCGAAGMIRVAVSPSVFGGGFVGMGGGGVCV